MAKKRKEPPSQANTLHNFFSAGLAKSPRTTVKRSRSDTPAKAQARHGEENVIVILSDSESESSTPSKVKKSIKGKERDVSSDVEILEVTTLTPSVVTRTRAALKEKFVQEGAGKPNNVLSRRKSSTPSVSKPRIRSIETSSSREVANIEVGVPDFARESPERTSFIDPGDGYVYTDWDDSLYDDELELWEAEDNDDQFTTAEAEENDTKGALTNLNGSEEPSRYCPVCQSSFNGWASRVRL